MDVTPLIRRDARVIQSYKGGAFKVSNQLFVTPILVMPDQVVPWEVSDGALTAADFDILRPYLDRVEILLLGTGTRLQMPTTALRQAVKAGFGLHLEAMDTGAACRTYNVLLAEGRKVAAALRLYD